MVERRVQAGLEGNDGEVELDDGVAVVDVGHSEGVAVEGGVVALGVSSAVPDDVFAVEDGVDCVAGGRDIKVEGHEAVAACL